MNRTNRNDELGAIVCSHVARGFPILGAVRAVPQDPADSGWQFMCYSGQEESIEDAQIWSVKQVLEREQSLKPFMGSKVGTRVVRNSATSDWSVQEEAECVRLVLIEARKWGQENEEGTASSCPHFPANQFPGRRALHAEEGLRSVPRKIWVTERAIAKLWQQMK